MNQTSNKGSLRLIIGVSILIPVAVAVLIFLPDKSQFLGEWVKQVPAFNALINTLTAIFLIMARVAVSKGNVNLHRQLMSSAFVLGAVFLVAYILYHLNVTSTKFGDVNGDMIVDESELIAVGSLRYLYYFVLLSHIILSVVVVPLVLFAFYFALNDKLESHRKVVKFTFPIWLYVSLTGVLTYILINPYYH